MTKPATNPETTTPKKPKSRSYGIRDVLNWEFEEQGFPKEWLEHLGNIPGRFHMYIDGDGGQGKTEYVIRLSKMLSNHMGKVFLNNVEQGKHKQIKDALIRNHFAEEVTVGKWMYSRMHDFDEYRKKISGRNSGRIQIIDSISYWPLNVKQIQDLLNTFKHKSFIFVGYKAHFAANKPIAHLCDIKVRVENFMAKPLSRYGGTKFFDIWPESRDPLFRKETVVIDTKDMEELDKEKQPPQVETQTELSYAPQTD